LTAPVLATNEGRGVRKQEPLALRVHCEEPAHDGAGAGLRPAVAGPRGTVKGIEAVVDRDLVTHCNRMPGEDLYAMAHGVRVAGVVEVAARRRENREAIESELTQMDAFPRARPIELVARKDSRVPAPNARRAKTPRPLDPASRTSTSRITQPSVRTRRLLLDQRGLASDP
jgi:hypothetical protein